MRIHKNGHDIGSVDEWFKWAPPKGGASQWKDQRSAKELAQSWLRTGKPEPPAELTSLLGRFFGSGIGFEEAFPECGVRLDEFGGESRNCDLVVVCQNGAQRIVISIEAKADEHFGEQYVGAYYDSKLGSSSNVPKRIEQLSRALFGRAPDKQIRRLRYQLVHAAAAALIAAEQHHAGSAIFLVHSFLSDGLSRQKLNQNKYDCARFIRAFPGLAGAEIRADRILGPVFVPGGGFVKPSISLYFGKIATYL
jgi:hypothetical protein